MKRLFTYFLQGLLLLGPLAVTLYSVFLMFNYADRLIGDPLKEHYKVDIPGYWDCGIIYIPYTSWTDRSNHHSKAIYLVYPQASETIATIECYL